METGALLDRLAAEGALLVDAAARAGWDAPVPRLGWTAGGLVRHTASIHGWVTELVRTRGTTLGATQGDFLDAGPASDAELPGWFVAGLAELVTTLGEAPAGTEVATMGRAEDPINFWAGRQAHETAIHRADAQASVGERADYDTAFAQHGIDEITRFARARSYAIPTPGTLGLVGLDGPGRLVTFGGERTETLVVEDAGGADATVRGTSAQLYLWLWNRDSDVTVDGDASLAAAWSTTVRIRRG